MPDSVKRKKKKKHTGLKLFLALVLLVAFILGGMFIWYKADLKPKAQEAEPVDFVITEGESSSKIAESLQEQGLIRSSLAARVYMYLNKDLPQYAGTYKLSAAMSLPEILEHLSNPANIVQDYISVTIPEGKWARDEAQILGQALNMDPQQFLDLWNSDEYIEQLAADYDFINPEVLENDAYFVKLEGYLFPDTYYLDLDATADDATRAMLDQFQVVYDKYKDQIEASEYSLEEILTFASVVQFECGDESEMAKVAGVFYNRFAQGMNMGSSVTVCYAMYDDFKSFEDCEANPDIDSPYNTYIHSGLPIGPIDNPGEAAIAAVLNPEPSDYLYFVSDIYGDGSIHYATTWEEHEANIDKYNLRLTD